MLIRPLFKKYQKELIAFCNTQFGRNLLAQRGAKEALENFQIVGVYPDGFKQLVGFKGKKVIHKSIFHPRSPFLKIFGNYLLKLALVDNSGFRVKDSKLLPFVIPHFMGETSQLRNILPQIYLATFYPDANVESTSVDGWTQREGVNEAFATIRAGAGTAANDSIASDNGFQIVCSATTDQFKQFQRSAFLFDSSSLDDGVTISSATFSLYIVNKYDNLSDSLRFTTSTPASNTALVAADYSQFGTTAQGTDKTIASLTTGAYNDWTLNATGITNVSLTGITKFGVRTVRDADNSAPTWSSNVGNGADVNYADTAGTTTDPKLVVVTTSTSGFLGFFI